MKLKDILNHKSTWFMILLMSFLITLFFSSRYSVLWSGDADAANSPIVWRAFLDRGFSAFQDWRPTFDNWYFTVYPVNFLLFFILGDDGVIPLLLSSVIFIFVINVIVTGIVRKNSGNIAGLIVIICLTFISPDLYQHGYLSHPFSHNSTNAYGFIVLALYVLSLKNNNIIIPIICSAVALMASVSDPWLLASFFLPLIITHSVAIIIDGKRKKDLVIYLVFFVVAASNLIQHIFNLPVHEFSITTFGQMISNINTSVLLTARILPLIYSGSVFAAYLTFFVWIAAVTWAFYTCFKVAGNARYITLFSFMSILGIYSSSIIGDQIPHQRFYLNIVPMVFMICAIAMGFRSGRILAIPLLLTLLTSIFSYSNSDIGVRMKKNPVEEYIQFLESNNLKYGYGSFWGMTMGVNWLSKGDIHITPVYFHNKTGEINFKDARVQTMKFWHTRDFIMNGKPKRQFIAISQGNSGDRCKDVELCALGVERQLGTPDEILNYHGIKLMVYNSPIKTNL
ncbi:Uncharacterised protein [Yersinia kristensenii]|nr:Uncharacterised protein [Yersinia kristensenii]